MRPATSESDFTLGDFERQKPNAEFVSEPVTRGAYQCGSEWLPSRFLPTP